MTYLMLKMVNKMKVSYLGAVLKPYSSKSGVKYDAVILK